MQKPIQGGPYSTVTAGVRDEQGKYQEMYSFRDLDHLQADLLGLILESVVKRRFGKFTVRMSQSEINECIIDTVFSKLPRGSVCLTRFDLEFVLMPHEESGTYSITFVDLRTDFNTKSFILRDPEKSENVAWHARIKHMAYEWLTKVLSVRAIRFERDALLESELRTQTGLTEFVYPQEKMKPIVAFVHYDSASLTYRRRRGSAVVLEGSNSVENVEWSD